ncbi:hypothetical protein TRFO_20510 [Tritrichomonas foetus]|uniref:Uncharacterized protein n=1 Tax=Tritrichomonas foetus TaxID=1144522 RepID=A0A1J4KG82_9EUKA|nr:hypothetical protein TRFO_20510 [Tritrichomonas foetus]|eukprot:OHT10219.1 hypothetical protein TRFO_20510 [Tritrichomonas foetus]
MIFFKYTFEENFLHNLYMDDQEVIKFGIFDDFSLTFGTGNIMSVFPINYRECIVSTSKEIIKIERDIVKMKYPLKFSTCTLVPDTDFLIGVSLQLGKISVFQLSDLSHPLLEEDYQTNQCGIFHFFYSPKSKAIVTVGDGIRVYNFEYTMSRLSVVKPKVSISFRSKFASSHNTPIMVSPVFDYEKELIILPSSEGFCAFNLDGKKEKVLSNFPSTPTTVYAVHPKSPKLLTCDSQNGMVLWGKIGHIEEMFSAVVSTVLAMFFIDNENVICLDSYHNLFILNIKTSRTFFCYTLPSRPSRLFFLRINNVPYLCVCYHSLLKALKIVIPWKVWNLHINDTRQISRCNKFMDASRILVATNTAFMKLYSPCDGNKMTVATPSIAVHPVSFFYDRGLVEHYNFNQEKLQYDLQVLRTLPEDARRDVLFFLFEDGTLVGFDTGVAPCEETMTMKIKASFMTICRYEDKWCYAVASKKSDLFLLDYYTMQTFKHFSVVDEILLHLFYHLESGLIIMVFNSRTILFDIYKGQIMDTVENGTKITSLFANTLTYGYDDGHLSRIEIHDGMFAKETHANQKPHSAPITAFSFSQKIWLSSSLDGDLLIWDYNNEKLNQICLPLPLYACAVMNGKKDILVATDTEVMQISIFTKEEFDEEVPEIDNYDKIPDCLSRELIEPLEEEISPTFDESDGISEKKSKKKRKPFSNSNFNYKKYANSNNNLNSTSTAPSKPISVGDYDEGGKNNKEKIDDENDEETIKKKLEMMQALNGMREDHMGVPKIAPSNDNYKKKEEEENQEKEAQNVSNEADDDKGKKKRKPKEGKELSDFINSSIDKEKAASKRKKVKKVKAKDNEPPVIENKKPKDISNIMDNLFGSKNKPNKSNVNNSTSGNIDFAALAKQFDKDEEPLILRMKKYSTNKDDEYSYYSDDGDDDDDESLTNKNNNKSDKKAKTINDTENTSNNINNISNTNNNNNNQNKYSGIRAGNTDSAATKTKSQVGASTKQGNSKNSKYKGKEKAGGTGSGSGGGSSSKTKGKASKGGDSTKSQNPSGKNKKGESSKVGVSNIYIPEGSANFGNNTNNNGMENSQCGNNGNKGNGNGYNSHHGSGNPEFVSNGGNVSGKQGFGTSVATDGSDNVATEVYVPNGKKKANTADIGTQPDKFNNDDITSNDLNNVNPNGSNDQKYGSNTSDTNGNNDNNLGSVNDGGSYSLNGGGKQPHLPDIINGSKSPRKGQIREVHMNGPHPGNDGGNNHHAGGSSMLPRLNRNGNPNLKGSNARNGDSSGFNLIQDPSWRPTEVDAIADQRKRCPTPPPIRWGKVNVRQRKPLRSRTPPPRNVGPPLFRMPPPNVIIDPDAVLALYSRGRVEFRPLVDRIERDRDLQHLLYRCTTLLNTDELRSTSQYGVDTYKPRFRWANSPISINELSENNDQFLSDNDINSNGLYSAPNSGRRPASMRGKSSTYNAPIYRRDVSSARQIARPNNVTVITSSNFMQPPPPQAHGAVVERILFNNNSNNSNSYSRPRNSNFSNIKLTSLDENYNSNPLSPALIQNRNENVNNNEDDYLPVFEVRPRNVNSARSPRRFVSSGSSWKNSIEPKTIVMASNDRDNNDLLASAVMSKMPKLTFYNKSFNDSNFGSKNGRRANSVRKSRNILQPLNNSLNRRVSPPHSPIIRTGRSFQSISGGPSDEIQNAVHVGNVFIKME